VSNGDNAATMLITFATRLSGHTLDRYISLGATLIPILGATFIPNLGALSPLDTCTPYIYSVIQSIFESTRVLFPQG
jgi:hypothetical protein